jgi:hypothetical protein
MSTNTSAIQRGKAYCKRTWVVYGVGIAALFAGMALDQTLAGLVVYSAAVVAGIGMTVRAESDESMTLTDEREAQLARRASHLTFWGFGYLGLFGFVALFFLDATGTYAFPAAAEPLLLAYPVLVFTWAGIYGALKYRT